MLVVRHITVDRVRQLVFPPARQLPVISVGTHARWTVEGREVAPVHLLLAFNGLELYVAAAGMPTVFVNGVPLRPRIWSRVSRGTIDFGDARLRVLRMKPMREHASARCEEVTSV